VSAPLRQRVLCEGFATAFLLAAIVGSGIAGAKLAGGDAAIALLANSLSTGAMLMVLTVIFGPVSGAHMNPVVSFASALAGDLRWGELPAYATAQVAGAVIGVIVANLMYELPPITISATARTGPGQWLAEGVATFGLLVTIFGCAARSPASLPYAVGLYIVAAFWFTASTSFANPAVTIGRTLSDTFAGIAPADIAAFIACQFAAALAATACRGLLLGKGERVKTGGGQSFAEN
jgi:glycerol uptake facilitator-like aquaporin